MIIDESRKPDFYIITGDKGYPKAYYKSKENIIYPQTASETFNIQEGYFDDITLSIKEQTKYSQEEREEKYYGRPPT